MDRNRKYIPALGFHWLTPLYDPLLKWVMQESKFKTRLIRQAQIENGHWVLDLGCGTGTLTIMIKKAHPRAEVFGLDADLKALETARAKAKKAEVEITFQREMAFELPYPDEYFDRVLSSLVFHHLHHENKKRAFQEVYRVLKPAGELHVFDFGKPHSPLASAIALIFSRLEEAADNIQGLLPEMMRSEGFEQVAEPARYTTLFGTMSFYQARKP